MERAAPDTDHTVIVDATPSNNTVASPRVCRYTFMSCGLQSIGYFVSLNSLPFTNKSTASCSLRSFFRKAGNISFAELDNIGANTLYTEKAPAHIVIYLPQPALHDVDNVFNQLNCLVSSLCS